MPIFLNILNNKVISAHQMKYTIWLFIPVPGVPLAMRSLLPVIRWQLAHELYFMSFDLIKLIFLHNKNVLIEVVNQQ